LSLGGRRLRTQPYHRSRANLCSEHQLMNFLHEVFRTRFNIFQHDISTAGIVAFGVCFLTGIILSSYLQREGFREFLARLGIDKKLTSMLTTLLSLGIFVGLLVLGINLAGIPVPWNVAVPGIGLSALQIVLLVFWFLGVIWFSAVGKRFIFDRFLSQSGLDRSLQYALAQMAGYVLLAIGLIFALENVGYNFSTLAVFAGAVGVGLGLGLQSIAGNFISGLILLSERPVKIGDRIVIDGVAGRVRSISIRATTILTDDKIAMMVPNSKLIGNTIINWSHESPEIRIHVPVPVSYGNDVSRIRSALLSAARENPDVLKTPEPAVQLDSFAENMINFEVLVWTDSTKSRQGQLRSDLNFSIARILRETGIEKFSKSDPRSA